TMLGPWAHLARKSLSDGSGINPFTSVVTAAGYAGAVASSSRDLAIWARALYAGSLLDPGTQAAMLDVSKSLSVGSKVPYGLGVMDVVLGGRMTVGHDGRLIGARATIRYLPDSGFTVAVTTNQDRIGPDTFGTALMNIAIASWTAPPPVP
ncbi:MAG TPA: serine hydrolase, partial [Candidatus Acidoferrum sp.]|nr:serine hydrolase [Candidatus Acidoferrum sp.]